MVWILQYETPDDGTTHILAFDNEIDACKQACHDILVSIGNMVILDPLYMQEAKDINDLIAKGTTEAYVDAIKKWNSSKLNEEDDYPQYWTVFRRKNLQPTDVTDPIILDDSFFKMQDDETEETAVTNSAPIASGASCHKCHDYNEYASPDANGKYTCRTCNMFFKVFS